MLLLCMYLQYLLCSFIIINPGYGYVYYYAAGSEKYYILKCL